MNDLEHLRLLVDALADFVDKEQKFFAPISHYVFLLKDLVRAPKEEVNQEHLKLLASKIEQFYASYRPGTIYDSTPRQTSSTDSTVKEINAIVARLTKLEAGTFKELFPSKSVAASQLITSRKVGQLKQVTADSQPTKAMAVGKLKELGTEDPAVIWVIYGRNEEIRSAMFEFLRSLNLKPKEWNEAVIEAVKDTGNASPSIPEILNTAFSKGRAVVSLMTPDDEVRLKKSLRKSDDSTYENKLTGQARPNVIFETGMAMAKYPDRTILVQLGTLRPFTDIGGLHIIKLDNSMEKRQELAERLRAIKCPANTKGTDWHKAGDFETGLESTASIPSAESPGKPSELSPEEAMILREIGRGQYGTQRTVSGIASCTRMPLAKVEYYADEMCRKGLLNGGKNLLGQSLYSLTHAGREYAVKHKLLD